MSLNTKHIPEQLTVKFRMSFYCKSNYKWCLNLRFEDLAISIYNPTSQVDRSFLMKDTNYEALRPNHRYFSETCNIRKIWAHTSATNIWKSKNGTKRVSKLLLSPSAMYISILHKSNLELTFCVISRDLGVKRHSPNLPFYLCPNPCL